MLPSAGILHSSFKQWRAPEGHTCDEALVNILVSISWYWLALQFSFSVIFWTKVSCSLEGIQVSHKTRNTKLFSPLLSPPFPSLRFLLPFLYFSFSVTEKTALSQRQLWRVIITPCSAYTHTQTPHFLESSEDNLIPDSTTFLRGWINHFFECLNLSILICRMELMVIFVSFNS